MYAYPLFPTRNTQSLDGFWQFVFMGENLPPLRELTCDNLDFPDTMNVPGCFDATPRYAGKRGVGAYRRTIEVTPGGKMRLILHGIGLAAKVFLDGREMLESLCPWSKQTVEFTCGASQTMELTILTDNRIGPQGASPLFQPTYDFYGYGGIFRSVELETIPAGCWFERAKIETISLEGKVHVSGTLHGGPQEMYAAFDGEAPSPITAQWQGEDFTFEALLSDKALWTPEHPALHTLTLTACQDTIVERFGLRTVKCSKGEIRLNDKPIRLAGFNRHDSHPQFGPAVPDAVWLEDLQLLREMHCNFIRGCHYPQSQRFLDLCDQMGFLVWEESLGWGNTEETMLDPQFRQLQLEQTANMVRHSINHPSVILWGFMNESLDECKAGAALLHDLAGTIRSLDKSRPVTNATRLVMTSLALKEFDVIGINTYPGWYSGIDDIHPRALEAIPQELDAIVEKLEADGLGNTPLILSEIGAAALYGWHDRVHGFWSEEYQADLLETVAEYFRTHARFSGLAIWQFCDARTYGATSAFRQRPRSFNNKGVLDEFRRPKMAFDRIKEKFQEILRPGKEAEQKGGE